MTFTIFDASQLNQNPFGLANILDNGGFEVWQRGTSFSNPAHASYTADRWSVYRPATSPTFTVTQESSTIDSGKYSLKLNITVAGVAAGFAMNQVIENYQAYFNKPLTISMRVWCNVANSVQLNLVDNVNHVSTFHTGNSTWQTLSVTISSMSSSATSLQLYVNIDPSQVQTVYLDSAMLVVGSQSISFISMNPTIDLMRCQRFYEIRGSTSGWTTLQPIWNNASNQYTYERQSFMVAKRVNPTFTFTKGSYLLAHSPTSGNGNGGGDDSPNWSTFAGTIVGTNSFYIESVRNATQTTFPAIIQDLQWTASADF